MKSPTLEERPLHAPEELAWACRNPEQPLSFDLAWDERCYACVLHAQACVKNHPMESLLIDGWIELAIGDRSHPSSLAAFVDFALSDRAWERV